MGYETAHFHGNTKRGWREDTTDARTVVLTGEAAAVADGFYGFKHQVL